MNFVEFSGIELQLCPCRASSSCTWSIFWAPPTPCLRDFSKLEAHDYGLLRQFVFEIVVSVREWSAVVYKCTVAMYKSPRLENFEPATVSCSNCLAMLILDCLWVCLQEAAVSLPEYQVPTCLRKKCVGS